MKDLLDSLSLVCPVEVAFALASGLGSTPDADAALALNSGDPAASGCVICAVSLQAACEHHEGGEG